MANFLKSKVVTGLMVSATVILAGVALFTAVRLYKLSQEGKTSEPTISEAAESQTETQVAQTTPSEELAFTIQAQQESPTPTQSLTPTLSPTSTPTTTPTPTSTPTKVTTVTTSTPTPTESLQNSDLPDAGFSLPTILGIGLGTLLVTLAIILAI